MQGTGSFDRVETEGGEECYSRPSGRCFGEDRKKKHCWKTAWWVLMDSNELQCCKDVMSRWYTQGLKKIEFQLVLWASSSHIFLSQDHFLLILVTDFVKGMTCGQGWFKSYLFWTTRQDCFQALYPIRQNLAMAAISPVFFLFPDFFSH